MCRASGVAITIFLFTCTLRGNANILFVPDDFVLPQDALDASSERDTVILRSGTYDAPLTLPSHHLTFGSEYILVQDNAYIHNCRIRPTVADPNHRCLDTDIAAGSATILNIVGITVQDANAVDANGGGMRLRNRSVLIDNCRIKSCAATNGGGLYADSCILVINESTISGCDAQTQGCCVYAVTSMVTMYDCELSNSTTIFPTDGDQAEIVLGASPLNMVNSRLQNLGNSSEGSCVAILPTQNSISDRIRLFNCDVQANNFIMFVAPNSNCGMRDFVLDSCRFVNNTIAFGLFTENHDSLQNVRITNNLFEGTRRPTNTAGIGMFAIASPEISLVFEGNYFINNNGGAYSCIGTGREHDPRNFRIQRNYFSGNSNFNVTAPPGGAVFAGGLSEGVLEFNSFDGNIGQAVDTWEFGADSYALHNFWGDSTGPYVAEGHPQGRGDTTDTDTIYDEWLQSENEIPDTSIFPDAATTRPVIPAQWFISSVYPNPFNSEFRIELDGMTGADFEVRLYDLLGREVTLLHSGRTLRGTLSFAAPANLAAGIYFISAHDRFYSETRKVLYLK